VIVAVSWCCRLAIRLLIYNAAQNPAGGSHGNTPTKRDPNALLPTPLERLLADDTTPIRTDGSDKFFGLENVSIPRVLRGSASVLMLTEYDD
jgi:hypothetical protein